jgi:TPP-dependent pyruvate/acetoin dehydrogenase alpha subunit
MTAEELIAFESDIATAFNTGQIKAPVHLYSGGEANLIQIFKSVRPQDWVLCSWRSHYQCLLKGVPPEELKDEILAGRSIALCFPDYRILSSALVGGVLPIAVGLGMGIKRSGEDAVVHCFMGDMTAETGIAHESLKYVENFDLPVYFHIEDNGQSVCTNTQKSWGIVQHVDRFFYKTGKYPHAGAGARVQF